MTCKQGKDVGTKMDDQPKSLSEDGAKPDPISQFEEWFNEAEADLTREPAAMTLATADQQGNVSARIVLLRGVDERGFLFYTNYESDKALDLNENPCAALVFYWQALGRQVRIEGLAEMLSEEESDRYFAGRPRGNQLAAHASPQSRVIADRRELTERYQRVERQFEGGDVPRPAYWGGYRVVPEFVEFWQNGEHRLHDRLRYRRDEGEGWLIERLGP